VTPEILPAQAAMTQGMSGIMSFTGEPGAIGRLPETLADRCILIRMQRETAAESCEHSRNLDVLELRRNLVAH
jgi:hypothetical protein